MSVRRALWFTKLQWTLRSLFGCITLVGIACFVLIQSTSTAKRFAAHCQKGEVVLAQRYCADDSTSVGTLLGYGSAEQWKRATITVGPVEWLQLLRGERTIYVHVPYPIGPASPTRIDFDWDLYIQVQWGRVYIQGASS